LLDIRSKTPTIAMFGLDVLIVRLTLIITYRFASIPDTSIDRRIRDHFALGPELTEFLLRNRVISMLYEILEHAVRLRFEGEDRLLIVTVVEPLSLIIQNKGTKLVAYKAPSAAI
jgi:hypothetical protein